VKAEPVKLSYSTNGDGNCSPPASIQNAGDRGYYAAPALSPNGTDLDVVYNAFTTPFRDDTTSTRSLIGVVRHADIGGGGADQLDDSVLVAAGRSAWLGPDNLAAEFLGDYVYAAATRTYGAAVWNDARNAAVCPGINAYWAALRGVHRGRLRRSTAPPRGATPTSSAAPGWIRRRSRSGKATGRCASGRARELRLL